MFRGGCLCGTFQFERPGLWATSLSPEHGTPAPHLAPNGKIWMIPAGALYDDPGKQVAEQLFVESIASWDSVAPGVAEFDEWGPEHREPDPGHVDAAAEDG